MTRLPITLEREPLVDALFEVRLEYAEAMADILPGYLSHEFGRPNIRRLPAAELPQPMRLNDPNLQFAPVLRMEWDQYVVSVGDRNIVVGCKLPYPKWHNFRAYIMKIVNSVSRMNLSGRVARYSLKYVNLLEAESVADQVAKVKMDITVGPVHVVDEYVNIQIHRHEADMVHIITLVTGAQLNFPQGGTKNGIIVDIDSIRDISPCEFGDFAVNLEPGLEQLRQRNKQVFFGCLSDSTLEELGPVYE